MAKINGTDVHEALAAQMGLSKSAAKAYTDFIFEYIRTQVETGNEVNITKFGKFRMDVTPPKKGRNLHTGEAVDIGARNVIRFDMSRRLKEEYAKEAEEA